jgi:hypothetical protein
MAAPKAPATTDEKQVDALWQHHQTGNMQWSSQSSDYKFLRRLGARTKANTHSRFYGGNGAVYHCQRATPATTGSRSALPNDFVIKVLYNYDGTLATHDINGRFGTEMKLCNQHTSRFEDVG